MMGLDDLRGLQQRGSPALPVFLGRECYKVVQSTFPYLCNGEPLDAHATPVVAPAKDSGDGIWTRWVANLAFHYITPMRPFRPVEGFDILPLTVKHGEDMDCIGFVFGEKEKCLILSDVSRVPDATWKLLEGVGIDLLVLDFLDWDKAHNTHFSLQQALECARKIAPVTNYAPIRTL
jgi:phosphoribosyl 1,2-cyclic phosphodiesterase